VELSNDTRTRFFCALSLLPTSSSNNATAQVDALIDAVDQLVTRYGGERFYAERRLHFSAAWSLSALPSPLPHIAGLSGHSVLASQVVCRMGEREATFELRPP